MKTPQKLCSQCGYEMSLIASAPCSLESVEINDSCDFGLDKPQVIVSWYCYKCHYEVNTDKLRPNCY